MPRIGHGYDVHALDEGLPLVLGGVRIPHRKGCVAHSDGDVPVHALCDALLGAVALGDIGVHFPDSDPRYRGIDSLELLRHVAGLLGREGYSVCNVDLTIAAEQPRIGPYVDLMRERIASALGVGVGEVSVKATTTERLGFVGREEGIAAWAVALVERQTPVAEKI
ncbi:2-C-methyl-D-erythritol 2,4-cyclodiphosphate synthase [Bacteroidia bacterium]|nr:2-C-methyl-D-erythritol 2,4-cyclodiphosphate synthase [Bacteroidia bacterium]